MIIGLDVGGTHTDAVLLGDEGIVRDHKVPTDHDDLFQTVLTGLDAITRGIDPGDIRRAVLSTTLTTNAIVQGKFTPVGTIVSGGPGIDPSAYRTNEHYAAVSGSIDHRGREIQPIDEKEIRKTAEGWHRQGIRYAAVISKFSVRNPGHELTIRNILGTTFEKVFMGHRVAGVLSFPRRIATTYLNAAVYPIHKQFFEAVTRSLRQKGLEIPIFILKADGGTMTVDASMEYPGQTILSGPSASIMGSVAFSFADEACLVLDIGGTTTDIALLINRFPTLDPLGIEIGPHKTLIRSLQTRSIGIGGDSVVKVVEGAVHVGPEREGPAMAHGGTTPTPTDALAVLGEKKTGDIRRSVAGFQTIADQLGLPLEEAARNVFEQTCRRILNEAQQMVDGINSKPVYTVHELLEGGQISPAKILVLGSPAHRFAPHLERLSQVPVGVVPRWKVANAIGAALARTTCDIMLFADTQLGLATAPEENFSQRIGKGYSGEDAVATAYELLRKRAIQMGAEDDELDMELIENLQFNMVRGFSAAGRNIRVRAQIKPGLINEYDTVAGLLADAE